METWDAITSRRNVREFADRAIPDADLDHVLEAGRIAPSSQNHQPWDFVLVTDPETPAEALRGLAGRQAYRRCGRRDRAGHPRRRRAPRARAQPLRHRPSDDADDDRGRRSGYRHRSFGRRRPGPSEVGARGPRGQARRVRDGSRVSDRPAAHARDPPEAQGIRRGRAPQRVVSQPASGRVELGFGR